MIGMISCVGVIVAPVSVGGDTQVGGESQVPSAGLVSTQRQ